MGWVLFVLAFLALIASKRQAAHREAVMEPLMDITHKRIEDLLTELTEVHKQKHEVERKAYQTERGAIALRMSVSRDEAHMRWVIYDDRLAEKDTTGDGLRLLKGPCAEEATDEG